MAPLPTLGRLVGFARDQVVAAARLPVTAVAAVDELRAAAVTLRRVAERVDGVLDEVEEPVRALAPGLRRLADLLDDPVVAQAPEAVRRALDDLLPALRGLRDTQQRVATIAASTDRITGLIDETSGRLAALPGAAALLMRRTGRVPDPGSGPRPAPPPGSVPGE